MPGCASIGCSNSARKGFLMKIFPRDPIRRKEWLVKMQRDKWTPTAFSCLCEVHFAPEMWEKPRVDGKRKLKLCAVPTIFSFSPVESKRKVATKKKSQTLLQSLSEEEFQSQPNTSAETNQLRVPIGALEINLDEPQENDSPSKKSPVNSSDSINGTSNENRNPRKRRLKLPTESDSEPEDQSVDDVDEEFVLFGKHVASKLNQMPIYNALQCQEKIEALINDELLIVQSRQEEIDTRLIKQEPEISDELCDENNIMKKIKQEPSMIDEGRLLVQSCQNEIETVIIKQEPGISDELCDENNIMKKIKQEPSMIDEGRLLVQSCQNEIETVIIKQEPGISDELCDENNTPTLLNQVPASPFSLYSIKTENISDTELQ